MTGSTTQLVHCSEVEGAAREQRLGDRREQFSMPRVLELAGSCSSRTCRLLVCKFDKVKVSEPMEVPPGSTRISGRWKVKATNGRKVRPNCIRILAEIWWDSNGQID